MEHEHLNHGHNSHQQHHHHHNTNGRTLSTKYESLDYDLIENVIYLEHKHRSNFNYYINRGLQRWVAIFLIAFATAMSGFCAGLAVRYLTSIKFYQIIQFVERGKCSNEKRGDNKWTYSELFGCLILPYLTWLTWNIIPSLVGSLVVTYVAPIAAGSGIPVVKCYLNGVKIPGIVHFKTYVTKLVGVVLSVVGGLAVGKEGPFIHCGAAIGAGLSQGMSSSLKFTTPLFKSFRNDRDKRDFVSAGASAGVAAAFGAPIGGVLFALEEGASFWNQALTWRIFFCSMMTSFILNLLMTACTSSAGMLAFHSLVNFGLVEELDYFWFEIPIYICISVFGGLIGASFCYFNLVITRIRNKILTKRWMKVVEVISIAIISATVALLLIMFASECRKLPLSLKQKLSNESQSRSLLLPPFNPFDNNLISLPRFWSRLAGLNGTEDDFPGEKATKLLDGHIMTFMCPPGEYSAMSSLWLKTSEGASSAFMVLPDEIWSIQTLTLFLAAYYVLAVITYGISVSSGVFIPSLLIGATFGRLIGLSLRAYFGPLAWLNQPNKFAIIGAASVLGGVVRMTISLTVIIIEATGCISFGLPVMICLMISKWVADSFIEGLYDIAIELANVPFLGWEPPSLSYSIYASDAMSPNVKVLQTTETVANIIHLLKTTEHNGFPVVDFDNNSVVKSPIIDQSNQSMQPSEYMTPQGSLTNPDYRQGLTNRQIAKPSNSLSNQSSMVDTRALIEDFSNDDSSLVGSFQRCSVTARRESFGRFRGLILRWQLLVMLDLKIFNENERSFENLNLPSFQKSYPDYPQLEQVVQGLSEEMYNYHIDLRSIMNPAAHTVLYSASFPRIYKLFRSLGLRHLTVTDDRNQVVGMVTRKDLARYVKERDSDGAMRFHELPYSH